MLIQDALDQPIAFDADGVLLNFLGAFQRAAQAATGRQVEVSGPSYSLAEKLSLTNEELLRTWDVFNTKKYWRELDPMPGAIEAIGKLQDAGFRNIHVVTAIEEQFRADRHANFRKLGFTPEGIHCVEHTTRWAKVPPITKIAPLIFVDDRIEHLHSNPQVPLLIHIDNDDVQYPDEKGRVDATVRGVGAWVDDFLSRPDYWLDLALANKSANKQCIATMPGKAASKRRMK